MKTYLTYGFGMSMATLLLALILFFLGYHSEVEKVGAAQTIATVGGLVIGIVGVVLGTRARRAEIPASEPFGYGRALGAGVMIGLFSAIFGIVAILVYTQAINPDFNEIMVQAQVAKFEASGMSSDQIAGAEAMMRKMMHPALQAVMGIVLGTLYGTIIALIAAAFLKRPAAPVV